MLLNPKTFQSACPDAGSRDLMRKTIEFFENKGLARIKHDDHERVWYADFLDFVKRERLFSTLLTPDAYGGGKTRWDTFRNCEMNEILGFYGLAYWYTWQVSILGLGPIWMSGNEEVKRQTAEHLRQGGIFAFGLSEKDHGADIYSSGMTLDPEGAGGLRRQRREVLHRQRERGGPGLGLREDGRRRSQGLRLLRRPLEAPEFRVRAERLQLAELRRRVPPERLPDHRRRHPLQGLGRVGRVPEHRQRRQVQPGLGLDRTLHPRALRGAEPRGAPQALRSRT